MTIKITISTLLLAILDICFIIMTETSEVFKNCVLIFVVLYTVIKYFKIDIIKTLINLF